MLTLSTRSWQLPLASTTVLEIHTAASGSTGTSAKYLRPSSPPTFPSHGHYFNASSDWARSPPDTANRQASAPARLLPASGRTTEISPALHARNGERGWEQAMSQDSASRRVRSRSTAETAFRSRFTRRTKSLLRQMNWKLVVVFLHRQKHRLDSIERLLGRSMARRAARMGINPQVRLSWVLLQKHITESENGLIKTNNSLINAKIV
jgi:hypothetical protein